MWPRVVEMMLAAWLSVSPFVFPPKAGEEGRTYLEYAAAILMVTLASIACTDRGERLRWGNALIALVLIVMGYPRGDGAGQNYLMVGLIVLMTAVIPSRATDPPARWRERLEDHSE